MLGDGLVVVGMEGLGQRKRTRERRAHERGGGWRGNC